MNARKNFGLKAPKATPKAAPVSNVPAHVAADWTGQGSQFGAVAAAKRPATGLGH